MTLVQFQTETQYRFAEQFLQRLQQPHLGVQLYAQEGAIEIASAVLARLFARIAQEDTVILPYRGGPNADDNWLLAGRHRQALDRVLERTSHFLVPTYAEFGPGSHVPERLLFRPEVNELQRLGGQLYAAGYYRLSSPQAYFDTILERLGLWMLLEERQPITPIEQRPTYAGLYATFTESLAAMNWEAAEAALSGMRQHHLSSADNLAFLRIQALAHQQRWDSIWRDADFTNIAKLRMPRRVRAALLTAFHHSELLPLEEQGLWEQALEAFRRLRPQLGLLLTSRLDLTQAAVVQVFAYESVFAGDLDGFRVLRLANSSQQVRRCLDALEAFLPPATASVSLPLTALQRAKYALADANYDAAHTAALDVEQPEERALLLMEIAFQSSDAPTAEYALITFWDLEQGIQAELKQNDHRVQYYLEALERLLKPPADAETTSQAVSDLAQTSIASWLDWFEAAEADADRADLQTALDRIEVTTDERFWTSEHVRSLADKLLAFVGAPEALNRAYARPGIRRLTEYFLRDESFPRVDDDYAGLYDALYTSFVLIGEINANSCAMLLRLADPLLARTPSRCEELWADFKKWYERPIPKLADRLLEALELFAGYGLQGGLVVGLYRTWVTAVLGQPYLRERSNLEAWLALGPWVQPGDDLLHRLGQELESALEQEADNPLAALRPGYQIAIFSFRTESAEHARQFLLARNDRLDVRICAAKDLDDTAKALAKNSDLAVVVSTCISHTLVYGIKPYLQGSAVYPSSSGSTAIVRAIEAHLRRG